MHIVLVLSQ